MARLLLVLIVNGSEFRKTGAARAKGPIPKCRTVDLSLSIREGSRPCLACLTGAGELVLFLSVDGGFSK